MEDEVGQGKIIYNKDIVKSIINLATKEISGVAKMSNYNFALAKDSKGVKIKYDTDGIIVDVFINIFSNAKVSDIAWRIQENVKTTVQSMISIKIKAVNVHVMNVDFISEV